MDVYACTVGDCVSVFSTQEDLVVHVRQVHGRLHCPHEECSKHYGGKTARRSLNEHKKVIHSRVKYGCPCCRTVWNRSNSFYAHRSRSLPGCQDVGIDQLTPEQEDAYRAGAAVGASVGVVTGSVAGVVDAGASAGGGVEASVAVAPQVQASALVAAEQPATGIVDDRTDMEQQQPNPPYCPPLSRDIGIMVLSDLLVRAADPVTDGSVVDQPEYEVDDVRDISNPSCGEKSSSVSAVAQTGKHISTYFVLFSFFPLLLIPFSLFVF